MSKALPTPAPTTVKRDTCTRSDKQLRAHDRASLAADCKRNEWIVGVDEVGRGAYAGPVTVGAAAFRPSYLATSATTPEMKTIKDSKKYKSEKDRGKAASFLRQLALQRPAVFVFCVQHRHAEQIRERTEPGQDGVKPNLYELMAVAAEDVCAQIRRVDPDARILVVVDGTVVPQTFAERGMMEEGKGKGKRTGKENKADAKAHGQVDVDVHADVTVVCLEKADGTVPAVSAASVLAKVERDTLMTELHKEEPHYAWSTNKGYGSLSHEVAMLVHGASDEHRPFGVKRMERLREFLPSTKGGKENKNETKVTVAVATNAVQEARREGKRSKKRDSATNAKSQHPPNESRRRSGRTKKDKEDEEEAN